VVRYLVEKNEVPVYRIFVMGLGNAKLPATDESNEKPAHGNRVEISLLKNNVDQLASMNQSAGTSDMGNATQSSSNSGAYSASKQPASATQPSNSMNYPNSAPATTPTPNQ
jgi:hypothetical protein